MATEAELQRERKEALRQVRRVQRAADTMIEKMERKLFKLLDRKTLIQERDAVELYDKYYKPFVDQIRVLENALIAFYNVSANY